MSDTITAIVVGTESITELNNNYHITVKRHNGPHDHLLPEGDFILLNRNEIDKFTIGYNPLRLVLKGNNIISVEKITRGELRKARKQAKRDARLKKKQNKVNQNSNRRTDRNDLKQMKNIKLMEQLGANEYYESRKEIVERLKDPYPHSFSTNIDIDIFKDRYNHLISGSIDRTKVYSLAGRIILKRSSGSKLVFYKIQSDNSSIQVLANFRIYGNKEEFRQIVQLVGRGDIIGVRGYPTRSNTGELSVAPIEIKLLSPCLHMLPKAEIDNPETRYRKRYLDLIVNRKSRDTFIIRSKIIKYIRNYLDELGFLEVETPMMCTVPGGASAKPFITHHNELDMDLFLRVAPELYLKMLIVGGYERVYEIGKNFRNEGIDTTHNPEFTSCEFYMAYSDCCELTFMTEDIVSNLVKDLTGSYILKHSTEVDGQVKDIEIDFKPPWKCIDLMQGLRDAGIENLPANTELYEEEAAETLKKICLERGIEVKVPTVAKMLDKLVEKYIEPQCINPTFIINHPQIMSPLAKWHRSKPGLTERFELFINGRELCNAYTELNDPQVQRQMFLGQLKDRKKGDGEAQVIDETFINALEFGMPPTAGWGLGYR